MDLEAAEEEAPGCGCEGSWNKALVRKEEDNGAGWRNGCQGEEKGCSGEQRAVVSIQLVQARGVHGAPDVGDFVFEEAAGEGKDAMDGLCELDGVRSVPCFFRDLEW